MSTTLLYHGFGIRGYRYVRSLYCQGTVTFGIEYDRFSLRCPMCRGRELVLRGFTDREFRSVRCLLTYNVMRYIIRSP